MTILDGMGATEVGPPEEGLDPEMAEVHQVGRAHDFVARPRDVDRYAMRSMDEGGGSLAGNPFEAKSDAIDLDARALQVRHRERGDVEEAGLRAAVG